MRFFCASRFLAASRRNCWWKAMSLPRQAIASSSVGAPL